MKIKAGTNLSNLEDIEDLKRFTGIFASDVAQALNGNLTFSDNVAAKLLTFVFSGASKTVGMNHGLGVIPSGYILAGSDVAMSLFDGNQKNTADQIYVQSTAAGTARILVFS